MKRLRKCWPNSRNSNEGRWPGLTYDLPLQWHTSRTWKSVLWYHRMEWWEDWTSDPLVASATRFLLQRGEWWVQWLYFEYELQSDQMEVKTPVKRVVFTSNCFKILYLIKICNFSVRYKAKSNLVSSLQLFPRFSVVTWFYLASGSVCYSTGTYLLSEVFCKTELCENIRFTLTNWSVQNTALSFDIVYPLQSHQFHVLSTTTVMTFWTNEWKR